MLELFHRFLSLYIQSANIVKVESRVKFTWTMPRRRRICERSSSIAKARAEAKFYFDYAEALFGIEIIPNIEY